MKIIYYGSLSVSDSDFPLLREYQRQGVDVVAYFLLADWNKQSGMIYADSVAKKDYICKASEIDAFKLYASYIDLDKIYVINSYHHKRYQWQSWVLWVKTFIHMYRQHASLIHFIWPPVKQEKILYRLPIKKVLTVHDPFPHSSGQSDYKEQCRKKAFSLCDRFVLLNESMREDFTKAYHIPARHILQNKMGEFDSLRELSIIQNNNSAAHNNTILYFGQIQPHKGIEYLLKAMVLIHDRHPHVKLVVAGKGSFYFDTKPYEGLDYIEFRNRYIPVPELATLLGESLFVVCPYKDATQSGVVQTAFSANVPLVVTNVGNMAEEVKDGVLGLVVPPCDEQSLAEAMAKLLDDLQILDRFKANIDKIWRPTMSWEPIAKKYIEMYKELSSTYE